MGVGSTIRDSSTLSQTGVTAPDRSPCLADRIAPGMISAMSRTYKHLEPVAVPQEGFPSRLFERIVLLSPLN
ncbi:hypothetical protein AFLA_009118 [Aspergillus flavus NRRL3357]|nr:hypothetical protein AFLA_009118 [Aspergillus flavus NRRL3357]